MSKNRSCENCGNMQCANSVIAYWWDECVESNFEKHWMPKEDANNVHQQRLTHRRLATCGKGYAKH